MKNVSISLRWEPWLPLYRVWGQGLIQRGCSPDRRVVSLREVLADLACKLRRLLMLVRMWLSSWSCGHVVAGSDMVLLCWPWLHYSHSDSSSVVLCNMASFMVFVVVSRLRPLSWIPSRSGWDHMHVMSVRIRTVGFVPVATVVWCYLIGATWHWDGVRLGRGDAHHTGP